MRRRRPEPTPENLPPKLAEFDPEDWWVRDPEDPLEVGYARITWASARRAYLDGEDWEQFTLMPSWVAFRGDGN